MSYGKNSRGPFQPGDRLFTGDALNQAFERVFQGNISKRTGIVALAGGGKTGATPLGSTFNRIITCASENDSVLLPPAVAGSEVTVVNSGAATLALYGVGSDSIDGLSTLLPSTIAVGAVRKLTCVSAGLWLTTSCTGAWAQNDGQIDPRAFGAKADLISLNNAQMAQGSATLSAALGTTGWRGFVRGVDEGKYIGVAGAGPAVSAWGGFRATRNPSAADTFLINGQTKTWNVDVNVGANASATALALVNYINANFVLFGSTAVQRGVDILLTATTPGAAGNAIALASSAGDLENPRLEVLGPNGAAGFLWGGVANGPLIGTIASVTDSTHAVLSVAASVQVTNVRLDFGSDNRAAIQAALAAASPLDALSRNGLLTAGRYPNDITRFGNFSAGVREVVLRTAAGERSRFGILGAVSLGTGMLLDFRGASLAALPGFTDVEMLGTDTVQDNVGSRVRNAHLEGNGYAPQGVWLRSASWFHFEGRTFIHGCRQGNVRLGYASLIDSAGATSAVLDCTFDLIAHQVIGIATGTAQINDPMSISVWAESNATDCQIGIMEGEGFRVGFRREGFSIDVTQKAHFWGHKNTGSMNVGFDLRGSGRTAHAYADSPGIDPADPTSPTRAYAAKTRGAGITELLEAFLNVNAMVVADGDCNVIKQYSLGGSGEVDINRVSINTSNTAYRFNQIIEYATQASKLHLKVQTKSLAPGSYVSDNLWTQNDVGGGRPAFVSLEWYVPPEVVKSVTGVAGTSDTIRLVPFELQRPLSLEAVGLLLNIVGGNAQVAFYQANTASLLPRSTPVYSSASIDCSAGAGTIKSITGVANTLPLGLWWFGMNNDSALAAFEALDPTCYSAMCKLLGSAGTLGHASLPQGLSIAQAYGAWPSLSAKVRADYGEITTALAPVFELKAA